MWIWWLSGKIHPGHTHTHINTCSFDLENQDQSQPALTIVQRKRSIKQQVHFLLRPSKTWPPSHCRSFVEEDKRSAPAEIPQPCERSHVCAHYDAERLNNLGHFSLENVKKKICSRVKMGELSICRCKTDTHTHTLNPIRVQLPFYLAIITTCYEAGSTEETRSPAAYTSDAPLTVHLAELMFHLAKRSKGRESF